MKQAPFTLSFHARGDQYKPSKIAFGFAYQHDVGDQAKRGRYKGKPYPYGASEIKVPGNLPWSEIIPALIASVAPLLPRIKEEGADDFHVSAAYYFEAQCNLEFNSKELALLASLNCTFCLSCYGTDQKTAEDE
ncbi:MAG TPA: hypothetical protein VKG78_11055 [Opitutaceae bacterium]|nr:hypothetical protein [Opitutaceae bacterium]